MAEDEKRKPGRPSEYSEVTTEEICRRLADGESLSSVCRDAAMPAKITVLKWLEKHEEFASQYARARELQADHFADEILEIADDGTNDWMEREAKAKAGETTTVPDQEHIARSRLRVDARKWLMARMAPKKYGDKVDLSVALGIRHEDALGALDDGETE